MKHVTVLLAALVLVLGIHTFATRADAPAGVQKWEYISFGLEKSDLLGGAKVPHRALSKAGVDGWELVSVTPTGDSIQLLTFKRPLYATTAAREPRAINLKITVARDQMRSIASAIDFYYLENRALPKSLDELTQPNPKSNEPFMKTIPLDPWKEHYEYKITNARTREYTISTAGEDRQWGTDDDMTFPDPDEDK